MLSHFVSVTKTTQITEVQVLICGSNVFILFLVEEEKMRLLHLINTFFEEARQVNSFTFLTFFFCRNGHFPQQDETGPKWTEHQLVAARPNME